MNRREVPSMNNSPRSLNTLHLTLNNMKDRCSKQQKQLDDLEREKEALLATNVRLNRDVQKLGSENRLLHEKNVELGDEILRNHSDLSDLQEQLNLVNFSNQSSDGEPMSIVPMPEESAAETLTEIARDNGEDADDEESWESLTAEVMKTSANMTVLKDELLRQQEQLKSFVQAATMPRELQDSLENSQNILSSTGIVGPNQADKLIRTCPMCETCFPPDEVTQEEFESHVLNHFQEEEEFLSATWENLDPVIHQGQFTID